MNTTKYSIGFALLGIGILIIGYALFASYGIFVKANDPPEVFRVPIVVQQNQPASFNVQDIEGSVSSLLQEQLGKMIPVDTVSRALNLFAWSLFAGILMFGGAHLASLGIKLLHGEKEKPHAM